MVSRGRTYRGEPSRPIPVWNGILEHQSKMGMAIWLYLWCLDRITNEQDGLGYVLGGAPVKLKRIADELGRSKRSLNRDLKILRSRYLRLRWTPYGYVILVLNSRKFGIWGRAWSHTKNGAAQTKSGTALTKNGVSKEDSAVDTAEEQQPSAPFGPWKAIRLDHPVGDKAFREFWETTWASKNGKPLSQVMGDCADIWQAGGGKVPGPFFRELTRIRAEERHAPVDRPADIVKLEVPY